MRLPDFRLERFFARYEFEVPYLLCSSDVEAFTLAELLALADDRGRELWDGLALGYTESAGAPALREEIAGLYEGVEPGDVLVFAGAEEAIFAFANVALGPGDHAVVVWPAYQSLHEVARSAGAEVTLMRLEHDSGWALDLDAVERVITPSTRAIVVNFPHNPTGAHLGAADYERLLALADEAGAALFSDEVYRWLEYDERERLPAAVERSSRAVSLGVMSKTFALPGLRIGWVASRDRELLARLAAFKDYTTICNSAPSEVLALIALRALDHVVARSREIVDSNLGLLDDFFERRCDRFEWVRPKAGPIAFPRLAGEPVAQFCDQLAREAGVLLLPGAEYEHPGEHFRLGFGRRNMPEALERLEAFVDARRVAA
ncbi:MAG TPA: aminotransferase class I/II-fold pyridoxal phosphate-dependent enzyme [Thermoleophilaceae bacterium]